MAENANSMGKAFAQVGEFLRGLSLKQQLMLGGAAVLVGAVLFLFVRVMAKPEMKPLFTGMTPQDAQSLASRLNAKNIKSQISPDGSSVSVEADQLDSARLETASQGMPGSGRLGFELFDKPNWGGSDFSEKVNYQRALEGELERTIQTLRGVEAVRVHLVVPPDSVFVERERGAKASVILRMRSGGLGEGGREAIANLVAGAVDKLRPENVAVIDAESDRPVQVAGGEDGSGGASKLEDRLALQLVNTLAPVVGAEHVRASVHVDRDLSSGEETQESYDPNNTVALTMQRSEERSGGSLAMGIPGTASNVPGAAGGGLAKSGLDDGSQVSKSENGTYAVNKVMRHTILPPGRIRRISAAVLVDDVVTEAKQGAAASRRKRSPEEMKQIEELVRAALGIDATRGDSISVQNLSFESAPVEVPPAPTVTQKVQTIAQQWSSLLRYIFILLLFAIVYALFLRPVKRQVLAILRSPLAAKAVVGGLSTEIDSKQEKEAPSELTKLKSQLIERAKAEPVSTGRLLQSWLREGGAS